MTTPRTAYTAGLRALADLLDQHPDLLPLPYQGSKVPLSIGFHSNEHEGERLHALAAAARLLMPGTRSKASTDDEFYRLEGNLHGLMVSVWAMRQQVCERVVTGSREVTREVADPAALAAVPTTTVTETVEDVEWICRPISAEQVPA